MQCPIHYHQFLVYLLSSILYIFTLITSALYCNNATMQVFITKILLFPFNFDFHTNFSLRLNPFEISILFLSLSPHHLFHFFVLSFIPMPSLNVCIVCIRMSMCPRVFPNNFKSSMSDKFLSLLLSNHSQLLLFSKNRH